MPDISPQEQEKRGKKNKRKSHKPGLDMTAMVDVAFLLLTFFVLSATVADLKVIEFAKPPKCEGVNCGLEVAEEKVLTVILDKSGKVFYYVGVPEDRPEETTLTPDGLRKIIQEHQKQPDPILVIKSQPDALYQSLIDVLDEIEICQVGKYALAPFTPQDKDWLATYTDSKLTLDHHHSIER
ncbi:MAG: biopolymer transporter ExbD [Bacteroidota bacterium]